MPYLLSKRKILATGPVATPVSVHPTFAEAWDSALDLFHSVSFMIVGCHLEPDIGPGHPAYAEFFVFAKPDLHETYVINEVAP